MCLLVCTGHTFIFFFAQYILLYYVYTFSFVSQYYVFPQYIGCLSVVVVLEITAGILGAVFTDRLVYIRTYMCVYNAQLTFLSVTN